MEVFTRFVCVRHGQSEGNRDGVFVGRTDAPLTQMGREQAALAGKALVNENFDLAFASPLSRAFETGVIALKEKGITPVENEGFLEIYGGRWENMYFDDLPKVYPEEYRLWREDFGHACPPEGEATASLGHRVIRETLALAKKHPGKNIFVASHATPIRMLRVASLGLSPEEAQAVMWPANASISVFLSDGERILCEEYDRNEHMGALCTRLSGNI